jgi:hypothetical protein
MTIFPTIRTAQSDLFSNSSGERLAEIGRHGGGVPPRFLGDTFDLDPKAGEERPASPAFHPDALAGANGQ